MRSDSEIGKTSLRIILLIPMFQFFVSLMHVTSVNVETLYYTRCRGMGPFRAKTGHRVWQKSGVGQLDGRLHPSARGTNNFTVSTSASSGK